ncbi:MAG: hypothetical protein H8D74_02270 [Chloroflexi bacterium]|nr:hypothetical protein [Chloroflexota bacterium]
MNNTGKYTFTITVAVGVGVAVAVGVSDGVGVADTLTKFSQNQVGLMGV